VKAVERAVAGPEAGKKGDLGKAEMLKTETLKGRMLRRTPESGGIGRILSYFHLSRA
jgi:hypothetical protein